MHFKIVNLDWESVSLLLDNPDFSSNLESYEKCLQGTKHEILLSTGSISACLWRDLLMGPLFIVINSGYLLAMMEMPGIYILMLYNAFVELYIVYFVNIFYPVGRLNDMWTISLQDREHACWEEASIVHFSIL